MRCLAPLTVLASLAVMAPANAQGPTETALCTTTNGPGIQRLRTLARQYHPEAITAAKSRAGVLVGFVLDGQCRVLRHTTGQRAAEKIDLEATLAALFPDVQVKPFVTAGITDASGEHTQGGPWIVWTVVKG